MPEELNNKPPKRPRGRPKNKVTKKRTVHEVFDEEDVPEVPHCPYDLSLLSPVDRAKVLESINRAKYDGGEPEIVHPIMRKPPKPLTYVRLIVHAVPGESVQCGPFNPPNIYGGSQPTIWLYRGEEVVVPAWVVGNLEGTKVKALQCDMSKNPPEFFQSESTRFPFHVIQEGLSKKDYEEFKKALEQKKHDPWKQLRTASAS